MIAAEVLKPTKGIPSPKDFQIATEADLSALKFERRPSHDVDVARFGVDPYLAPPGEPHWLYPEVTSKPGALARLGKRLGRAFGIDQGGDGNTIGNAIITWAFTGTAQAGALAWDQFWILSETGDQPINATYAIGTSAPAANGFSNAQVADFFAFQPFCVVNFNVVNASAAAILSGLQMQPVRITPFGTSAQATIYNLQYQTTVDFQTTRGQIPFSEKVDAYTYLRINSPIQGAAATFNASVLVGLRPDRRAQVPKVPPQVLNSSGASR